MTMRIFVGLCAASLLLAAPLLAYAQNHHVEAGPNWYAGVGAGYNSMADQGFDIHTGMSVRPIGHVSANENAGYAFLIDGGYDFGRLWYGGGIKLGGELAYRDNGVDDFKVDGAHRGGGGDTVAETALVNVINEFLPEDNVSPYIGLGVGFARLEYSNYGYAGRRVADGDDDVFAVQWVAGMRWDINHHASVTADYRYLHTSNPDIRVNGGGSLKTDYLSHTIMARFQYSF
jgi:opacity protein-like surface antigen